MNSAGAVGVSSPSADAGRSHGGKTGRDRAAERSLPEQLRSDGCRASTPRLTLPFTVAAGDSRRGRCSPILARCPPGARGAALPETTHRAPSTPHPRRVRRSSLHRQSCSCADDDHRRPPVAGAPSATLVQDSPCRRPARILRRRFGDTCKSALGCVPAPRQSSPTEGKKTRGWAWRHNGSRFCLADA